MKALAEHNPNDEGAYDRELACLRSIEPAIAAFPATTIPGLAIKAMCAAFGAEDRVAAPLREESSDNMMLWSIARDLLALAGPPAG